MPIFNNSRNIESIRHNYKEIIKVYANNVLVYDITQRGYNHFVFDIPAETRITLASASGTYVAGWDRVTDWGDGISDTETYHYYKEAGTYTVRTKHLINDENGDGTAARQHLIKCSIGCTDRLKYLFYGCSRMTEVNLIPLEVLSFTDMTGMFSGCQQLVSIKLPTDLTVSGNLSNAFANCRSLQSIDLTRFNFTAINNMSSMFSGCSSLTSINGLNSLTVSSVTNMSYMFSGCKKLTSINLTGWNPRNVTNMDRMFSDCTLLSSVSGLSNLNLSKLQTATYMFDNCTSLTSIDLSYWTFNYIGISLRYMFSRCSALTSVNLNGWNTRCVTSCYGMFYNCTSLTYNQIRTAGCDQDTINMIYDAYYNHE